MSSYRVIQYLEGEAADGTALGPEVSNRREVETFIATGTIAIGDVVMSDVSVAGAKRALSVLQAGVVATGNPLAIGVALNAATAGQRVEVVTSGYVEGVKCNAGTIAAGAPLSAGIAAGEVETSVAGHLAGCFGVAMEAKGATTANKVAIMVKKQF